MKASCIGDHYFIHYTLAESTWNEEGNPSRGRVSSASEPFSSSRTLTHIEVTDQSTVKQASYAVTKRHTVWMLSSLHHWSNRCRARFHTRRWRTILI